MVAWRSIFSLYFPTDMKQTLFFVFLFIANLAQAQIKFQDITFQEALEKANTEGKLLFLQFEAATCNQCNEVANKGLADANVVKRIDEGFIPLLISMNHPDRTYIGQQYNFSKGFGTLFVIPSGTLIHTFNGTASFPGEYLKQMDLALEKAGESLKINELEALYKKGNKSPGLLETLLLKKRSLNLATDDLLDEYVTSLPADSLTSTRTLQFIAQMAPAINSKADKALRQDRMAFNKAWYAMNQPLRININNRIIYKSLTNAITTKNERYAKQVAHFARSTHSGSPSGIKAYDQNMLQFYEEIGDTAAYFQKAIAYYEHYFSMAHADSIKRVDSANRRRLMQNAKKDTIRHNNKVIIRSSFAYSPLAQHAMKELNNGAWNFYKMTKSPSLLSMAMQWAAKALNYHESPEVLHTYACLSYKLEQKQQALSALSKGIALKEKEGYSAKEWNLLLDKMKKGVLID